MNVQDYLKGLRLGQCRQVRLLSLKVHIASRAAARYRSKAAIVAGAAVATGCLFDSFISIIATSLDRGSCMATPSHDGEFEMRNRSGALLSGGVIGIFGGLIGLGGAEFRLPLLIGTFRFAALEAVILNKAMSLVVVAFALPFRAATVPFDQIAANWPIIVNLLAGSLAGAWLGAGWAMRLRSETLYKVIAVLLVGIAIVLVFGHDATTGVGLLTGAALIAAGIVAGLVIGVVASLLGVAGGELLIPTIVLLFGADIRLAGSLSLAISLPTMLVGFARYSQDQSFSVIARNMSFMIFMAFGSIIGAFLGGQLLGIMPTSVLLPTLAAILMISAFKVWRHR
jgi:uncharacterized protein